MCFARTTILFCLLLCTAVGISAAGPADSTAIYRSDSLELRHTSKILLPAFFYSPETKIGGGGVAALFRTLSPGAPTSSLMASLIYTQRKQIMASLVSDLYLQGGKYRITGGLGYQDFPDLFYGIGNDTPDINEEKFTARTYEFALKAQREVRPGIRVGPEVLFRHRSLHDLTEGGMLESGDIPGSENGTAAGIGLAMEWDRRDNLFFPSRGHYVELSGTFSDNKLGSDFNFANLTADLRLYTSIRRNHVVAVQGYAAASTGRAPFHLLPMLGGQNLLRGYYEGRFRDKAAFAVQAEYRFPVWKRLGAAVFAGTGDVAPGIDEFEVSNLKHAGGAGLRYRVNDEGVNIRVDYAVGRTGTGMYITLQEAF